MGRRRVVWKKGSPINPRHLMKIASLSEGRIKHASEINRVEDCHPRFKTIPCHPRFKTSHVSPDHFPALCCPLPLAESVQQEQG